MTEEREEVELPLDPRRARPLGRGVVLHYVEAQRPKRNAEDMGKSASAALRQSS